jgi:transposase InsO family protein
MTEFAMQFMLQPCHILLAALIGWANERQQQIIEFQNDQIEALLKKLGKKRVLLTDDQRRVLAVKGHALGRRALLELTTIVTPDTILRWHRELVAKKWDQSDKRMAVGRPPKSPNLNAFMERWFRSLKSESLDRMIFFGKRSLERAVTEYVEHYHVERNHQGLENELIEPGETTGSENGTIDYRERLGGLLKYYHRRAA